MEERGRGGLDLTFFFLPPYLFIYLFCEALRVFCGAFSVLSN